MNPHDPNKPDRWVEETAALAMGILLLIMLAATIWAMQPINQ